MMRVIKNINFANALEYIVREGSEKKISEGSFFEILEIRPQMIYINKNIVLFFCIFTHF